MVNEIYSIAMITAFLLSGIAIGPVKKFLSRAQITAVDQQKKDKPTLVTGGGLIVAFGFLGSVFLLIGWNTFYQQIINTTIMLAIISSVLVSVLIGTLDDMGVKNGERKGLKQWQKPLLTFFAAVPLMAVAVGTTSMYFPIIGNVEFGVLYSLVLVPLAVIFVSNAYNMLAGTNGLEAGLGVVSMFSLGVFALLNGRIEAGLIAFTTVGALIPFLIENWYPAKMLPGDSLTYLVGAIYASIAIVGNMEKFAAFLFIPWIAEFFLKATNKFKARSYGDLKDGYIEAPYKEIYSLTHAVMKSGKVTEQRITLALIGVEIVVAVIGFTLFFLGF